MSRKNLRLCASLLNDLSKAYCYNDVNLMAIVEIRIVLLDIKYFLGSNNITKFHTIN